MIDPPTFDLGIPDAHVPLRSRLRLRDVPVRMHRPAGLPRPAPVMLWTHGGYVPGTARREDAFCRRLSHLVLRAALSAGRVA